MEATRRGAALGDVVENAAESLLHQWVSVAQAQRVGEILRGFVKFSRAAFDVHLLEEITPGVARDFVMAVNADGSEPSIALEHLRRSALRLLFRSARREGLVIGDPTLDLRLPAREPLSTRPLTDEELVLCRSAAVWSINDGRRAATWALAEATCRSSEAACVTVDHVDLDGQRVRIEGTRTTAPRWGLLTDWGAAQIQRRLESLPSNETTRVVYEGDDGPATGQVSACIAIRDIFVRAGLGSEPGVRPGSVVGWAGRQVLEESGRIDEVALRLGVKSLDRAARIIAWDWGAASKG